jgi:hypothetical protein
MAGVYLAASGLRAATWRAFLVAPVHDWQVTIWVTITDSTAATLAALLADPRTDSDQSAPQPAGAAPSGVLEQGTISNPATGIMKTAADWLGIRGRDRQFASTGGGRCHPRCARSDRSAHRELHRRIPRVSTATLRVFPRLSTALSTGVY